ncbi:type II toxin-antitoxin system HigB family toxin [Duganella levis]|jgi:mRNA interferase HigB|uniref:Type II toxin-antitoxin system HigB family toxin n=1 Tax=Duganella levis TaxID=2692169 RepID=A0ABW9W2G2_9BURK|nr:type II toxin-antitoxin system HigB family toxin [Duganella levis]
MRLVSLKVLKDFCSRRPDASGSVRQWAQRIDSITPGNFSELRSFFGSVDYVSPFTVFNLGGNKFRLIATVHYASGAVFIRWMLTHGEYDKWTRRYLQGKIKK